MVDLLAAFDERLAEVEAYLDFLKMLESRSQCGPPKLEGVEHSISPQQQKIMYSSVYLQLYNLVESTMISCIDAVAEAATATGNCWKPGDLCNSLRKEWVRHIARTHVDLTPDNRLSGALRLCDWLLESRPISKFSIEKGNGGNWDDSAIEKVSKRFGFNLRVSEDVYSAVKCRVKDDLGPLALVKDLRNQLAHGTISFAECARETTVAQLEELKDNTSSYLREVIKCFIAYIKRFEFLDPSKRPI